MIGPLRHTRIGYCHPPSLGGPLTRFVNLRKALTPLGWDLLFVGAGRFSARTELEGLPQEEYVYIGEGRRDHLQEEVSRFVQLLTKRNINLVITYGDPISMQSLPHLPPSVKIIYICSTPTRYAMSVARVNPERISRIIAVSDAIRTRLESTFGIPAGKVMMIPSEVDLSLYPTLAEIANRPANDLLRLIFIGRVRDIDKGVDLLPRIGLRLQRKKVRFSLTIAGDGPQLPWLMERFQQVGLDANVAYLGGRRPAELPRVVFGHDVLLMPSRFEGCPRALLEGMAAGLVPVVSHLRGATDTIVEHANNGLLCRTGRADGFVEAIDHLYRNPERLKTLAVAARRRIEEKFSLDQTGKLYHELFTAVLEEPPTTLAMLPMSQFRPDEKYWRLDGGWRSRVPGPIKRLLLTLRANIRR